MPRSRLIATHRTANPRGSWPLANASVASSGSTPAPQLGHGRSTLFPGANGAGIADAIPDSTRLGPAIVARSAAKSLCSAHARPAPVALRRTRAASVRRSARRLAASAPKAPTLCEGWDVKDLICHLLVRESSLVGALGIALSPLSGLTEKEMARLKEAAVRATGRAVAHSRLHLLRAAAGRRGVQHAGALRAPRGHPAGAAAAGGDATSRTMPPTCCGRRCSSQGTGPGPLGGRAGRGPAHRHRRDHDPACPGSDPVEVRGPVSELVMYLLGRDQVRELRFDGPGGEGRAGTPGGARLVLAPGLPHRMAGGGQRAPSRRRSPGCRSGRRWRRARRPRRRRRPAGSARPPRRRRWRSRGR